MKAQNQVKIVTTEQSPPPCLDLGLFLDPICPWCYIGYIRAQKALSLRPDFRVRWRWFAFQLNPTMPAEGMARRAYLRGKFGTEASSVYNQIEQSAQAEGLNLNLEAITRTPNSLSALQLIYDAEQQGQGEAMVTRLFRAFFHDGQDIGDRAILYQLGREVGLDRLDSLFTDNRHRTAVQQQDHNARHSGLSAVPCFVVNGRHVLPGAQSPNAIAALLDIGWQEVLTDSDSLRPAT